MIGQIESGHKWGQSRQKINKLIDAKNNYVTPQDYGYINQDGDVSAIFQAMFDDIDTSYPKPIIIPPGDYEVNELVLPKLQSGSRPLLIWGYGARLKTLGANTIMKRIPENQTEASTMVTSQFHFKGLTFTGTSQSGSKGLVLGATYGSSIEECYFNSLDEQLVLSFSLMTKVDNCMFQSGITTDIKITTGVGYWPGASAINSQSNSCDIGTIRHYCRAGQLSCIDITGVSGMYIKKIICEGDHPVNNIVFNQNASTVVKEFNVDEMHLENNPTNAHIKLNTPISGTYTFNTIYAQYSGLYMVDCGTSPGDVRVVVKDLVYIPTGTKFKGTCAWYFVGYSGMEDIVNNGNYWDDDNPRGYYSSYGKISSNQGSISPTRIGNTLSFADFSTSNARLKGHLNVDLECHSSYAIRMNGNIALQNSVGTTLGNVVKKVKVLDPNTGSIIGYLPLYDNIE